MERENGSIFIFAYIGIKKYRENTQTLTEVVTQSVLTSGQDGSIDRYTLPPCTTKRTTTSLKIKNNQNGQKIKLYGTLTTKELKKKHSSRLVGEAERTCSEAVAGSPTFAC